MVSYTLTSLNNPVFFSASTKAVDHLLARRVGEHGRRDDVDLVGRERRDQRGELHRLDLDLETGISADLGDEINHQALNAVGLGVEEGEGHPGRGRAHLEHLLRRARHRGCKDESRDRGLNHTFEKHRTPSQGLGNDRRIPLQQQLIAGFAVQA
jgi:hypothetical protein